MMLRAARAALFAVIPAEVVLGVLIVAGVGLPPAVVVAMEALVLAVLVLEVAAVRRLYREERRVRATRLAAVRAVWARLVPVAVRRLLALELKNTASLGLWLARRRHGVPRGAVAVGYFGAQAPALLVFLGAMVVEFVVVEIVLRSVGAPGALRAVLLVLDGYSILLALSMIAAFVTRPHVVAAAEVRVRSGALFDLRIPADRIAAARRVRAYNERGTIRVDDDVLTVAVSSQVNIVLELTAPVTAVRPLGRECEVRTVRCFADDPAAAIAAIAERVPAALSNRRVTGCGRP
ncbi:hypothetical protein [Dactylosporangium sp. NPDC051541]|uniref:hypothetical protein n=1 Tax=Dactylosporangium sp. NPDC051541 TaxID=3363977 RepID=UPI0037AE2AAE